MVKYNADIALEILRKDVLPLVNSWGDLFSILDAKMARVREDGSPIIVFDTLFYLYAFVVAMRDLPEEGDARVIADEMLKLLTTDSAKRLGFDLHSADSSEVTDAIREAVQQATQAALDKAMTETLEQTPPTVVDGKPILH